MIDLNTEKQSLTVFPTLQVSALEHSWQELPAEPDILFCIFYNLGPWEAGKFRSVCQNWNQSFELIISAFSKNDNFCQKLFHAHFPSVRLSQTTDPRKIYRNLCLNLPSGMGSSTPLEDARTRCGALAINNGTLFIGSLTDNGIIEIWDTKTHLSIDRIHAHQTNITCIIVDGEQLFSSSSDGEIKIWNLKNFSLVTTLKKHTRFVNALVIKDNKLYSGCLNGLICVWNLKDFTLIDTLDKHTNLIRSLTIVGDKLYSSSRDLTVHVWNLNDLSDVTTLHKLMGSSLLAIENDKIYSACSYNNIFRIHSLEDLSCLSAQSFKNRIVGLFVGSGVVSLGFANGEVSILDLNTCAPISTFKAHEGQACCFAAEDGKLYSADNFVNILDFTASSNEILKGIPDQLENIEFEAIVEGQKVSSRDESLLRWIKQLPKATKEGIFLELFKILEFQFEDQYPGCAEDAFYGRNGQYASRHQKAEAIRNYLKKK
jgi:hypothetical protein